MGMKQYELTNHLGNVLAVVSDRKLPYHSSGSSLISFYQPEIISSTDYYPFGMPMSGRDSSLVKYRFGFNGKEKDDEAQGKGDQLDFGSRIYNARLGRWLSVDPMQANFVSWSPYKSFLDNPIFYVDKDGTSDIVYVVNVPNANGKPSLSNADVQKIINKANSNLHTILHLNTTYVLYDPAKSGGDIKRENTDKNDAIVLLGNPESVKAYDRKNHLSEDYHPQRNTWSGEADDNSETTLAGEGEKGITYVDGDHLNDLRGKDGNLTLTAIRYGAFLLNHGTGHVAQNLPRILNGFEQFKHYDHRGRGKDGTLQIPNIMMSANASREYFNEQNTNHSVMDVIKAKNEWNALFIQQVNNYFQNGKKGTIPKDNYDHNRKQ